MDEYLKGMLTAIDDCKEHGLNWGLNIISNTYNEDLSSEYDKGYYDAVRTIEKRKSLTNC